MQLPFHLLAHLQIAILRQPKDAAWDKIKRCGGARKASLYAVINLLQHMLAVCGGDTLDFMMPQRLPDVKIAVTWTQTKVHDRGHTSSRYRQIRHA